MCLCDSTQARVSGPREWPVNHRRAECAFVCPLGSAPRDAEQLSGPDLFRHLARLRAIHMAVLEFDHRIHPLTAEAFELVAFAAAERPFHDLVLDSHVVERLL